MKDWLGFWTQFKKIHEDTDLYVSDNFQFLLQSLSPDSKAYEVVSGDP